MNNVHGPPQCNKQSTLPKKLITQIDADLVFQARISFLKCFRPPRTPIRKVLVYTGMLPCLVHQWPQILQACINSVQNCKDKWIYVFVRIGGLLLNLKVSCRILREQAFLRKSITPRKSAEKWVLLSLAFYNASSLHTVDCSSFRSRSVCDYSLDFGLAIFYLPLQACISSYRDSDKSGASLFMFVHTKMPMLI